MASHREQAVRPVIGVTADIETPLPKQPGRMARAHYSLRENYCSAVAAAGGLPLVLPHEPELAQEMVARLDGLVVTGGAFDVDPSLFGAETRHPSVTTKDKRTDFELAATRAAMERDLPLLGICGGQQLLNVALGGTLIQHIPDALPDALAHEQSNDRGEPGHEVILEPGSLLHRICGKDRMAVNTAHHQAVEAVGPEVRINARATDGVIEGIEAPARRFCLGVQWHPEYGVDTADALIFQAFVAAARSGAPAALDRASA